MQVLTSRLLFFSFTEHASNAFTSSLALTRPTRVLAKAREARCRVAPQNFSDGEERDSIFLIEDRNWVGWPQWPRNSLRSNYRKDKFPLCSEKYSKRCFRDTISLLYGVLFHKCFRVQSPKLR